jgi:RNA polymerase sigma factor (sigma-70 family)
MTTTLTALVAQEHTRELLEAAARRHTARPSHPDATTELERVVRAAKAGDAGAWSALVERFTARVRSVARRHRLAAHDVEDVVQTTWLRLLEHIDGVREPSALGAWLETTARRESLRTANTGRREELTDAEPLADAVEPVDERRLADRERRVALGAALEQLAPRQRALLSLLLADPVPSYGEISRTLDMPIGSIGPTRARCLARLRRDRALAGAVADDVA